jgi:hypothetical protein
MLVPADYFAQGSNSTTLNPSTGNSLSMANVYSDEIGFVKHSAFKIKVRPRQALATVNVKLMEQQQREVSRTVRYPPNAPPHKTVEQALLDATDALNDNQTETIFITEIKNNPDSAPQGNAKTSPPPVLIAANPNLMNFGFRPSTVRKLRTKTPIAHSNTAHKPSTAKSEARASRSRISKSNMDMKRDKSSVSYARRIQTATTKTSIEPK